MQNRLVSLLTPMYNTEKYVHRLLDSVLSQDYPAIEMIVIDDGSTDGSGEVVEGYADRFSGKGYTLRYVYQPNYGQSVAVKNGLRLVTGEYLAWPDSDDYYAADDAISRMVAALDAAPGSFQMVRTQATLVEDGTWRPVGLLGGNAKGEEGDLFEDCLFVDHGFFFCSGAYMVRTAVLEALTGFDIYTSRMAGQNWQLMLPVLYRYRCLTILEPLYTVVLRSVSHTRKQSGGYARTAALYDAYLDTQVETLKRMKDLPAERIRDYQQRLRAYYDRRLFPLAVKENDRSEGLKRLPACRESMGKCKYFVHNALLHLKGGTYVINGLTALLHLRKG